METLLALFGAHTGGSIELVRDLAVTMLAAGAALLLFNRIKLPQVLGYLVVGVIVGPFTFAGINFGPFADFNGPVQNVELIRTMAELGLIFLLFSIGLEIGWQRIRQIGLQVVIIGFVEMTTMFALGYAIGHQLLGWTRLEGVFLGAAMSISSSAILVKTLRDTRTLFDPRGRIIVGVLVVEDFVAVVLLTVLSGISTTAGGAANMGDIGYLVLKLVIFGAAALGFGALFIPRLIKYIAVRESDELLLITSLALCFGLALIAYHLGLSAAAGAFLVGMVLGDTEHSVEISWIINPLRDMFAALFFVSLGMLMDIFTFGDYLVPALIVAAVFIGGKIIADTAGALLSGHDGRTALQVGTGMPQLGEFSLAMVKTGAEHGVVGSFLNPVVTVATALTALVYPVIFHSATRISDFLERISPAWLKEYCRILFLWLTVSRRAFSLNNPLAHQIKHSVQFILLNMVIVLVLIGLGTVALEFSAGLAAWMDIDEGLVGLLVGGVTLALCIPSAVSVWRNLQSLTEAAMNYMLPRWSQTGNTRRNQNLRLVLRDSILIVILILPTVWSIPFIAQLLLLGSVAAPVPALILLGVTIGVALAAFQMHSTLENAFRRTFLGSTDPHSPNPPEPDDDYQYEDAHLTSDASDGGEAYETTDND